MSVIELQNDEVTRIFNDKDPLPAPWEPVRAIRDSDIGVINLDSGEVEDLQNERHQKAIEGLGWLMLTHSD